MKKIKEDIEKHFNVPDISVYDRTEPLPELRYLCITLCKEKYPKRSLKEIGKLVGLTNHASVLHGLKRFKEVFINKKEYRRFYLYYKSKKDKEVKTFNHLLNEIFDYRDNIYMLSRIQKYIDEHSEKYQVSEYFIMITAIEQLTKL